MKAKSASWKSTGFAAIGALALGSGLLYGQNALAGASKQATPPARTAMKAKTVAKGKTASHAKTTPMKGARMTDKVVKTDAEWKKELTPEQYEVLRKHGTERAFTGEYTNLHDKGIFVCAACGNNLFSSDAKFDSGTGWPSFWKPLDATSVDEKTDSSYGMKRTEILCDRCGGHLGHVFDDGPAPTGLRYCMNSVALKFEKK